MGRLLQSAHRCRWAYISTFCLLLFGFQELSAKIIVSTTDISYSYIEVDRPVTSFSNQGDEYIPSAAELKKLAINFAIDNDYQNAARYADEYIMVSKDLRFIEHEAFRKLKSTKAFLELQKKYKQNFGIVNLFYLFSALIGLFIGVILNVRRSRNLATNALISGFILIHSVFILHIFLYLTNLKFQFPHILFMSTLFSFLYGPLIYFYVKRIAQQYRFRKIDLLHLIPTVVIAVIYMPVYTMSGEDKLATMLHMGPIEPMVYVTYTFLAKLLSLLCYGYFLVRIYHRSIRGNTRLPQTALKWQKTIIGLGMVYIVSYMIYGLIISRVIPYTGFLYHLQVVAMAVMVLYIGFKAYLEPRLFTSELFEGTSKKYRKSGLTPGLSLDLKNQLLYLLEEEKIYRNNTMSLERVAEMLQTSRHNASQVINEHFDLNFFDLINKYRISEATEILKNDTHKNLNIIDVAYEVGFNNKVTFNKSFKKNLSLTPTQFLLSLSR